MLEQFVKERILWERPHAAAGEQCEEEGAAEEVLRTDCNPQSPSPCAAWGGEEVEESGAKLSLAKREGRGKVVLVFFLFLTILLYF